MKTEKLTDTLKHIVPAGTFETFEEAQDFADTTIDRRLRIYKTPDICVSSVI